MLRTYRNITQSLVKVVCLGGLDQLEIQLVFDVVIQGNEFRSTIFMNFKRHFNCYMTTCKKDSLMNIKHDRF